MKKINAKQHPINSISFGIIGRIAKENNVSFDTAYNILKQARNYTTRAKDNTIIFYEVQ